MAPRSRVAFGVKSRPTQNSQVIYLFYLCHPKRSVKQSRDPRLSFDIHKSPCYHGLCLPPMRPVSTSAPPLAVVFIPSVPQITALETRQFLVVCTPGRPFHVGRIPIHPQRNRNFGALYGRWCADRSAGGQGQRPRSLSPQTHRRTHTIRWYASTSFPVGRHM